MNKKFFFLSGLAAVALLATSGWLISQRVSNQSLSDIAKENIEALAGIDGVPNCKWTLIQCGDTNIYYEGCLANGTGNSCTCGEVTRDCPEN